MALVLIVDDELAVVEVLRLMIEDEGHEVLIAANGREGLAAMWTRPLDLVFTDTQMPVMTGPVMVAAMRERADLACLPVIAMSAMPEAEVGHDYAGYTAFLRKPFRLTEVMRLLNGLLL